MTRTMYVQYYYKNYYHNMQYNRRIILSVGTKIKVRNSFQNKSFLDKE